MSRLDNISLDGIPDLEGVGEMYESVFDPATREVSLELKSLVGHIASTTAGCRYCQAQRGHGH